MVASVGVCMLLLHSLNMTGPLNGARDSTKQKHNWEKERKTKLYAPRQA